MRRKTKFRCGDFCCDIAIYKRGKDLTVHFYEKASEHTENNICDYVIVSDGYGYLSVRLKGERAGILSGYLRGEYFTNKVMISSAIYFVLNLIPDSHKRYIPYNVFQIKTTGFVQYNGEFDNDTID